jgi:hypothetical protein
VLGVNGGQVISLDSVFYRDVKCPRHQWLADGSDGGLLRGLLGRDNVEGCDFKRSPVVALLAPPSYAIKHKSWGSVVPPLLQEATPSSDADSMSTSTSAPSLMSTLTPSRLRALQVLPTLLPALIHRLTRWPQTLTSLPHLASLGSSSAVSLVAMTLHGPLHKTRTCGSRTLRLLLIIDDLRRMTHPIFL